MTKRSAAALAYAALYFASGCLNRTGSPGSSNNWPAYGGGPDGIRYSTLRQINQSNVNKLRVVWTYDATDGPSASQTQPIVVDGVLFGITPRHRVVALDAATGRLVWRFDSGLEGRGPNRGVVYWKSGNERRIFAAVRSFVYALDAASGKPITNFGDAGRIDLREGLGREAGTQSVVLTTPGIVYRDLLIVGGRTPESLPAPPGDIRAFDAMSGKLRWSFHTIPHPGEFGYDSWPDEAWTYSGSANNWAGMALDERRGIVYVPTGSAAPDFYGGERLGDNLFANTLLALKAETGERIWHFQGVRHDIWDRDFPSPPALVAVRRDGRTIDAVAQTTKQGWVYVFDRTTGTPLFPIEYRAYPPSTVPGEVAAKTQPLPTRPAPYSRQLLTEDLLTNRTPDAHLWALERFRTFVSQGQFVPLSVGKETVFFPGFDGGAEWGGSAFDPETSLLYVNANDLAWTSSLAERTAGSSGRQIYLTRCAECHGEDRAGSPPQMPPLRNIGVKMRPAEIARITRLGAGRMPSFPTLSQAQLDAVVQFLSSGEDGEVSGPSGTRPRYRFTGYHRFLDPDGYPAVAPPWGTLNAINLDTGEYAWKIPLGEYPELAEKGLSDTGSENYGGPIVTAGGLVFIGATNFDRKFRAFDKLTGKLLWETILPMSANATPATFVAGGRQLVVVHATGGKGRPGDPSGGVFIAFGLP